MKVGVITFHAARNHGAMLQAHALCRVISGLGHHVQLIDFRPDRQAAQAPAVEAAGVTVPWHSRILDLMKRRALSLPGHIRQRLVREWRFERFVSRQLPLTARCYRSDACFQTHPLALDAFVCGSDQIWNPYCQGFEPAYFLSFADPAKARLVAYAPSFAEFRPGSEYDERIARLIERFHFLSARERDGQETIAELTGRAAEHVLDPTLLLDDYSHVAVDSKARGDFIAAYSLQARPGMEALVAKAKEHFGLPAVTLGAPLAAADHHAADIGPREWLGYLRQARFVCTDSFHGTAFSIVFRRQFLNVPHTHRNGRVAGLLEQLGLSHRQIKEPDAADATAQLPQDIDYRPVGEMLQPLREASLEYLRRALAEIPEPSASRQAQPQ